MITKMILGTVPILFLFLKRGCVAEVLESDRECFVADPGIEIEEYLPQYLRHRNNVEIRGQNFQIIRIGAFRAVDFISLSLRSNNIKTIQAGAFINSSIRVLDLSENSLKCIFKGRVEVNLLEELNLSKNQITYIEPDSFPDTLLLLNLEHNRLTEFDTESLQLSKNVREINLAQNNLISLNFKPELMKDLEKLELSYNNLYEYNFSNLTGLLYLDLRYNNLRRLQNEYFLNMYSLEELDLSNNKLEDVRIMTNRFPKLVILKLQNNNIKQIEDDLFLNTNLKELDLSDNSLHYFNFSNNKLGQVWRLRMNNVKLKKIHPSQFQHLDSLNELELSNNSLTDFDANFILPKVWRLDLSYNWLTEIDNNFIYLNALGSLDLSHNKIQSLNIADCNLDKIWKIKLNNNNLLEIRDRNIPLLNFLLLLDLSNNRLRSFDISKDKLRRLRIIDLSFNHIPAYVDSIFNGYSALKFLSLRSNSIDRVPTSVLYGNPRLFYLDLSFNMITSFKYNGQPIPSTLRTFNIFGNPINCMHLRKIEKYVSQNRILMDICDTRYLGDGRTPICVEYDCDCDNIDSPFTERYLQEAVHRRNVGNCSFAVLAHNGA